MHVKEVGRRLDEIRNIYEEVRELKIPYSVISKEDQERLERLIETVFDRYNEAINDDVEYLDHIRKPLSFIKFTLRRWIDYYWKADERRGRKLINWFLHWQDKL